MKPRICFVSQRYYPGDARLQTAIQALQAADFAVDMVCMRGRSQPTIGHDQGVTIYRIPSLTRQRAGKLRYIVEYASFLLPAFFLLALLHLRKRYQLVYVTNLPDVLILSALVPRLLGAKLVFDIRECSPEMFADRFKARPGGRLMKLMIGIEQMSIRMADLAITCTEQMRQAVIRRGADPAKVAVTLNVWDAAKNPILPDPAEDASRVFRIITHGTIIKRYGHEVLVRAMAHVVREVPVAHLTILGRGQLQPELEQLVEALGLRPSITFGGFVPDDELFRQLRQSHVGVVPLLRTIESDLVHTYKMFEYIALGVPVVISRTSAVEAYFDDTMLCYFESGDERSLADAIIDLYRNPDRRCQLARNALHIYEQHYSPARQRAAYLKLIRGVVQGQPETVLNLQHEN
ncbi:MAG: glycosyltransferase family 4 protein [Anaerolineae bacterium]|nr:glycosyltransferase family 4 protein [Anaerolineae bacterium]